MWRARIPTLSLGSVASSRCRSRSPSTTCDRRWPQPRASAEDPMADILIVDDETTLAQNCMRFFERKGHTVRRAASGEAALALWEDHRPDVTILDLRLPDMSGFDV